MKQENYAMLCDFYEFTMSNGYFRNGFYQKTVYFDVFFQYPIWVLFLLYK
jgi:nicotinate phosphoribosyltransferase